jgi:hypothetical protein
MSGRLPAFVSSALLAATLSCAGRQSAPAQSIAERAGPTRSGADCAEVVAWAAADPDARGLQPPRPDTLFLPPFPIPPDVRGRMVIPQARVREDGRIDRATIHISELPNAAYAARLHALFGRFHFIPAVLDGCAVPARYVLRLTL